MHGQISLWKNELGIDPERAANDADNVFARKQADVYAEYQARLRQAGAMDFDDLLLNVVRLFREHPDVLDHYRARFEHILVDEYQDTNQAQNEIVLGCSRVATRTCASSATPIRACTDSAVPTSATSCSSRTRSTT